VFGKPQTATVEPVSGASMGVVVEGQRVAAAGNVNEQTNRLPEFCAEVERQYFIDIFNRGDVSFEWNASTSAPWVKLSALRGTVDHQQRIWVSINWDQVPAGEHDATVTINEPGQPIPILVHVTKPKSFPKEGFMQVNGIVSIEAEHFTAQTNADDAEWTVIPTLGRSGDAVMILPVTATTVSQTELTDSPTLEYTVYLEEAGELPVTVYCLPTHAITKEHGLRYAVSFDDAEPQIVDFDTKEWSEPWSVNVLRGAAVTTITHNLKAAGQHTLKIRMVDPGVVIDKIVIGNLPTGYSGPPETAIVSLDKRQ
jgi:hypothetical protein